MKGSSISLRRRRVSSLQKCDSDGRMLCYFIDQHSADANCPFEAIGLIEASRLKLNLTRTSVEALLLAK